VLAPARKDSGQISLINGLADDIKSDMQSYDVVGMVVSVGHMCVGICRCTMVDPFVVRSLVLALSHSLSITLYLLVSPVSLVLSLPLCLSRSLSLSLSLSLPLSQIDVSSE
jgi:hypothetical protein